MPGTSRQLAFMRAVLAAGTSSFGSCAGLQVAVAAAGGDVAKAPRHRELADFISVQCRAKAAA